ncbi:MAG: hypothetical protein ISS46_03310 [Candidatus Omnitrophica bacterium]|nr:hypothetical protein [Candidatus Omnitrophota bacterium]
MKKTIIYNSLIVVIVAGVFICGGSILKATRDEGAAWDREGSFYNKLRKKDLSRLSILSGELKGLNQEKIGIEKRLDVLLSEKVGLEKEKKELLKRLEELRAQTKDTIAGKEQELKARLSGEYENEIAALKEKAAKQPLRRIEEVDERNRELQNNFKKVSQSNEHLIKKIEDLKKVRDELEEELRRRKLE